MMGQPLHYPLLIRWEGLSRWAARNSGDTETFYLGADHPGTRGIRLWPSLELLLGELDARGLSRREHEQSELDVDQLARFATEVEGGLGLGAAVLLQGIHALHDIETTFGAARGELIPSDTEPAFRALFDAQWDGPTLLKTLRDGGITPEEIEQLRVLVARSIQRLDPSAWPSTLRLMAPRATP